MAAERSAGRFAAVADPTDLDQVRAVIASAPDADRLVPLGLHRLVIAPDATSRTVEQVSEALSRAGNDGRSARVVLLVDGTPIRRAGRDLKGDVEADLGRRYRVERVVLGHDDHLLVDDEALDAATRAATGADCVVTVGGGTVTDIGKVATERAGSMPLVVVQTAASVDGYTDNVSVVLRNGVKRTVPSRWPDAVIADTTTIREAPAELNSAGLGEVLSLYTAPADWRLAALVGLDDTFHETPRDLLLAFAGDPAEWSRGLAEGDPGAVQRLTQVLAIRGIGTGVAGTTACLSGVEHLVSHMLDMVAAAHGLPIGLHGAQVGVASLAASAAWHLLLDRLEAGPPPAFEDHDPAGLADRVRAAFERVDASGAQGEECWSDYSAKLSAWGAQRDRTQAMLDRWSSHAEEFRGSVPPPENLAAALRSAGAATGPAGLEDWIDEDAYRWALTNCLFMRNRFTVVDLLFLLGWWTERDVEAVLDRARRAAEGAEA